MNQNLLVAAFSLFAALSASTANADQVFRSDSGGTIVDGDPTSPCYTDGAVRLNYRTHVGEIEYTGSMFLDDVACGSRYHIPVRVAGGFEDVSADGRTGCSGEIQVEENEQNPRLLTLVFRTTAHNQGRYCPDIGKTFRVSGYVNPLTSPIHAADCRMIEEDSPIRRVTWVSEAFSRPNAMVVQSPYGSEHRFFNGDVARFNHTESTLRFEIPSTGFALSAQRVPNPGPNSGLMTYEGLIYAEGRKATVSCTFWSR
jgi:hypothetical protein